MAIDPAELRATVARDFPTTRDELARLIAIPGCDFPGHDPAELARCAALCGEQLDAAGFPSVEQFVVPEAPPYICARDHRAGPDRPTLLLYAHYDVQPPLDPALWTSPPFTATERNGRLYGRGSCDDKAAIALHAAAYRVARAVDDALPVNLTVIVEGEEETGSPHLAAMLTAHQTGLAADAVVVPDVPTLATGVPCMVTSLRGLLVFDVTVRCLSGPVHNGLWGGALPDAGLILSRLLAGLADDHGQLDLAELQVPQVEGLCDPAAAPFDPAAFARDAGALDPTILTDGPTTYRRLWTAPALNISSLSVGGGPGGGGNVINGEARARIGLRIAPGMGVARTRDAIERALHARCPPGAQLALAPEVSGAAWHCDPQHSFFDAARAALRTGFGRDPLPIGCGASIPFVHTIETALDNPPILLLPVEDPLSNPHGIDESVHLGDLQATIASLAALIHHEGWTGKH